MSMHMWCTGLLCFLLNPFTDWLTNKLKNILDIIPSGEATTTNGLPIVQSMGSRKLNNKTIAYDSDALKTMRCKLHHDQ